MLRLHVQQTIKKNDGKPNDSLKNGRNYINYGWQISLENEENTIEY